MTTIPDTIPHVPVDLDRERVVCETFASLTRFEEETGLNSMDPEVMTTLNATSKLAHWWSLLITDDPDLELAAAAEIFSNPGHSLRMNRAHLELLQIGMEMTKEAMDKLKADDKNKKRKYSR